MLHTLGKLVLRRRRSLYHQGCQYILACKYENFSGKKTIPDFNFCFQKSSSPKKHLSFQKIMQEKMLLKNYVKLIEEVLAHASRTKCRYFKFSARLCCRKKIALFVIFWDFKNSPCWNTIAKSLMSEYLILGGIWECQWII